jgi:hypothetical protein
MISCYGVDPGGSRWRIADMSFPSPNSPPASESVRAAEMPGPAQTALSELGFFGWSQRQIRQFDLGRDAPLDEAALVKQLATRVQTLNLGEIYDEQKTTFGAGPPHAVGVCHPCAAPPIARRMLPVLFDGKPIGPPRRSDFAMTPREADLAGGVRLCGIESPLAGCLDLIARGEVSLPAELMVLTGHPKSHELALVRAGVEDDELSFAIRGSLEVHAAIDSASLEQQLRTLVASPAGAPAPRRIVYFGEHLEKLARRARTLEFRDAEIVSQAEDRIAVGAARYAAMCLERTLHGSPRPIRRLHVSMGLAHDLGLICEGEDHALYWHCLLRRGEALPEAAISIPVTGSPPASALLAARKSGAAPPLSWLEQAKWREHDLLWFAAAAIDLPKDQTVKELAVRLASAGDRLACRWSDVTVEITPVT